VASLGESPAARESARLDHFGLRQRDVQLASRRSSLADRAPPAIRPARPRRARWVARNIAGASAGSVARGLMDPTRRAGGSEGRGEAEPVGASTP